uniref:HTH CENPB-type domain-containing protein n=1 Tax=Anopheles culicifacies TaxID=139723 RepID=A0A182MW14_9DIPT
MLEFGLPLSSYYKIISNKDTTKQQCLQGKGNVRRNRRAEFPNVERCLLHWISQEIDRGHVLEGPAIKAKAKLFSVKLGIDDFSASNGWLDGFKKRHAVGQIARNTKHICIQAHRDTITLHLPSLSLPSVPERRRLRLKRQLRLPANFGGGSGKMPSTL